MKNRDGTYVARVPTLLPHPDGRLCQPVPASFAGETKGSTRVFSTGLQAASPSQPSLP